MQTGLVKPSGMGDQVLVAVSRQPDTASAVHDVLNEISAENAALVLVFFAADRDAHTVAQVLKSRVGDRAIGGTTAGELSQAGFTRDAVTALAIPSASGRAAISITTNLSEVSLVALSSMLSDLTSRMGFHETRLPVENLIWLSFLDGLSGREELVTPFLARHRCEIPLVGGSLAGGRAFDGVRLVHDGKVHTDAAAMILLEYARPFELIHHTHHEFSGQWLKVTRVSSGGRVIEELDGQPAALRYADALGVRSGELQKAHIGAHPLGFRFRGKPYPCSIMRIVDEHHLFMAYSVQEGEELALLEPGDIVESSRAAVLQACQRLRLKGAEPEALLLFHCLGRLFESEDLDVVEELFSALNQAPVCGLNTYGEQFQSMHMNHSMTGLLFGS